MQAVTFSDFRQNHKPVVIISLDDYNSLVGFKAAILNHEAIAKGNYTLLGALKNSAKIRGDK